MGIAPLITKSKLNEWEKLFGTKPRKLVPKEPKITKACLKCFYWTGIGNIGNACKCYCGSCPAKARDEAGKQGQLRGRNKRK
jgi:hypothetical protein